MGTIVDDAGTPRSTLGRPRSAEADDAIADAAMALLAESGFEGVTVEEVAHRAGVAKSTVYRRFPGKPELLVTVLQHACQTVVDDPDTGSVVDDLTAIAQALLRSLRTTPIGRALPAVALAAAQHPQVAEAHRAFVAGRRQVALAAVRRGIERGEVDPSVDPDLLIDMVVGPVFHREFFNRTSIDDAAVAEIATRAVRGCAPTVAPRGRR